jgi:hypothetical protein
MNSAGSFKSYSDGVSDDVSADVSDEVLKDVSDSATGPASTEANIFCSRVGDTGIYFLQPVFPFGQLPVLLQIIFDFVDQISQDQTF